jgi:hypothetical protein
MSTDPALPDILGAAAGRVDQVGARLASASVAMAAHGVRSSLFWSGPVSRSWVHSCLQISRELQSQASAAGELADTLRRAAKSAAQRIYWERQAELARQRAEAAARARAQQQQQNNR